MECTGDEFLPWVAQYLVMKRASIEHNFHTLYSSFIDHLKKPEFLVVVIAETYRNIKVLCTVIVASAYLLELAEPLLREAKYQHRFVESMDLCVQS